MKSKKGGVSPGRSKSAKKVPRGYQKLAKRDSRTSRVFEKRFSRNNHQNSLLKVPNTLTNSGIGNKKLITSGIDQFETSDIKPSPIFTCCKCIEPKVTPYANEHFQSQRYSFKL